MDELLSFKEALEFLKVGEKTLIKLLQEEDIPARKLGREWRFSRGALIEWVASGSSKLYSKTSGDEEVED